VEWLDQHGIPYWDLCFMREKTLVDADIYVEDSPEHVGKLMEAKREVICFTNSTNRCLTPAPPLRADSWTEVERMVRQRYYAWREARGLRLREAPGHQPPKPPPCDCSAHNAA
jgi:5'(3')-deoxyribonucleotidase